MNLTEVASALTQDRCPHYLGCRKGECPRCLTAAFEGIIQSVCGSVCPSCAEGAKIVPCGGGFGHPTGFVDAGDPAQGFNVNFCHATAFRKLLAAQLS